MVVIGEIVKISENKYMWTVEEGGDSPNFLIEGCQTHLSISRHIENNYCSTVSRWDVAVHLDSKIAPTTGVNIAVKILLKSNILLCENNILSSGNITPKQSTTSQISTSIYVSSINTNLPVQIECEFFNLSIKPTTQSQCSQAAVLDQKLRKEFQELFDSGKFSDLTIVSKGIEFKTHKNVLSARSKVFAAMLKHCTKEAKESKIEIDDIDGDTMEEVLKFIYTGKVTDIDKMAYDLVAPADKYEIKGLLALCEETLVKTISLENLKHILRLINLYDVSLLKKKTFEFLQNNSGVMEQKDFTDFLQKLSPLLLTEIISFALLHKAS